MCMAQKQIIVLEDLGITNEVFEQLLVDQNLDYRVVWDVNQIKASQVVEGIVTVKTAVNSELIDALPNLKFVAVAFTGFDCVDLEACRHRNISVFNVPSYASNSVAELVLGLAISLLREIPKAGAIMQNGAWLLNKPGLELAGKTIGIVGTGAIGTLVAQYFKTMGCKIIGWSRSERTAFKTYGTYVSSLSQLLKAVDIVSVHVPLNKSTKGLIGKSELTMMKKTAMLINCARGPVVVEEDLCEALKTKSIAAAAVDVFDIEPIAKDHPFLSLSNVVLTPHIAYKTEEALKKRAQITSENIAEFCLGTPQNLVS